ncbi:MAG: PKD domain containing protein, partial [Duncaniella sp.]|nr:PKD domain containing protein [Duncaniella sp.]
SGGEGQRNGFLIENAMYPDLTHINLQYIDFIKVQTGVNSKSGWLGEVSTEVFNFQDLSLMPQ